MASNLIHKYSEEKTRVRTLAATVTSGTPLLDPVDDRPAVALTNSGDSTKTITSADLPMGGGAISLTYANGGVGLEGKQTTLAYDGTWEFSVTGAGTSTADGVPVYITSAGELTLTADTNTLYGSTDAPIDYFKRAGIAAVRVGA